MNPDLSVVEDVHVSVAFAHSPDGPAVEVFTLTLSPGATSSREAWEERYVTALDAVLSADAHRPYRFAVTRWHSTWESSAGHAEISLRMGLAATRDSADDASVSAVLAAFRDMVQDLPTGDASRVSRSEAITVARRAVTATWAESVVGDLSLAEEEHRPVEQLWTIGLVGPEGTQYRVQVGLVHGAPTSVHARRIAPAEIVDSVGTT